MRKVTVKVTYQLELELDDYTGVDDVMGELNSEFTVAPFHEDRAKILDDEMIDWHNMAEQED